MLGNTVKSKSHFLDWFVQQHGPRERLFAHLSDDDLREFIEDGKRAAAILYHREVWDEKRTSALYAWNLSDKDKK
jgi:hypothetical protein